MERKRLTWFILIRVVLVSCFLVLSLILNLREPDAVSGQALFYLIRLIIATYLFSIVSLFALKATQRYNRLFTHLQIIWDLLFVTLLILITGGINSPFSFIYIISIANASALLSRKEAYYTASLCSILYGGIIDLQFYGILNPPALNYFLAPQYTTGYLLYTISLNTIAFYLTAFLTGYLSERTRRTETALQEKLIDYEELERLNSAIVTNMVNGLITVNMDGQIRVFNRYAENLTGFSQAEAYNKLLEKILPGIGLSHPLSINPDGGGEATFRKLDGEIRILHTHASPLTDKDGGHIGMLLVFSDITQMKQMEAELKRADRLAAIGELSARMAHEIRNPLASISGSVQLLAQGGEMEHDDRKLLDIVLRETDRLNGLITDFLAYARPKQPEKVPLSLARLLDDMRTLLASDCRFCNVRLDCDASTGIYLLADPDHFKQVFWNLFLNAAEAMPAGGDVRVRASVIKNNDPQISGRSVARITVSDNGPGMDKETVRNIFSPFFTTKAGGTGLGLATVYRIIETHGGRITVESLVGKGTEFAICLPAAERGEG